MGFKKRLLELRRGFMRIKLINPNTTASMTQKIETVAKKVAYRDTEIIACHPAMGPVSIEGHYDEALSVIGILEEIHKGEKEGIDGYIIACFGDPGLLASREATAQPVMGIAEAAMHTASLLATGFSIVTTLSRTRIIAEHLVKNYGMTPFCRKIRAIDLPVLDLENAVSSLAKEQLMAECRRALAEDGSGAIVLGCSGMADLATEISQNLDVPVIGGVSVAVKWMEGLISLGLKTSKVGDLAFPIAKPYQGILQSFSPFSS